MKQIAEFVCLNFKYWFNIYITIVSKCLLTTLRVNSSAISEILLDMFVYYILIWVLLVKHAPEASTTTMSRAGWWKQLVTLTRRSFVNMTRDIGYYWLRLIIYSIVSICVGTIFYDVGTGYTAILARGACGGFITGFMVFMSIGSFPSFIEDMKVV